MESHLQQRHSCSKRFYDPTNLRQYADASQCTFNIENTILRLERIENPHDVC